MEKRRSALLLDGACLALCLAAPALTDRMLAGGGPCFSRSMGLLCPACGGTHCVNSFFRFRFAEAFTHNPAVFCGLIYGFAVLAAVNLAAFFPGGSFERVKRGMLSPPLLVALAVAYCAAGFLRNVV